MVLKKSTGWLFFSMLTTPASTLMGIQHDLSEAASELCVGVVAIAGHFILFQTVLFQQKSMPQVLSLKSSCELYLRYVTRTICDSVISSFPCHYNIGYWAWEEQGSLSAKRIWFCSKSKTIASQYRKKSFVPHSWPLCLTADICVVSFLILFVCCIFFWTNYILPKTPIHVTDNLFRSLPTTCIILPPIV